MRESCIDSLHRHLCESCRWGEGDSLAAALMRLLEVGSDASWRLCEWKKLEAWIRGVCRSDGVQTYSLTDPSLIEYKRNDPQINVKRPNNSNVLTGIVFGNFYKKKKYCSDTWISCCHTDLSSFFCPKNSICPQQQSQAVTFHYSVVVVSVSGNLYLKITMTVSLPDWESSEFFPWKQHPSSQGRE